MKDIIFVSIDFVIVKFYNSTRSRANWFYIENSTIRVDDK